MRENRTYGSEGREAHMRLSYPYPGFAVTAGETPALPGFAVTAGETPALPGFAVTAGETPALPGFAVTAGGTPALVRPTAHIHSRVKVPVRRTCIACS